MQIFKNFQYWPKLVSYKKYVYFDLPIPKFILGKTDTCLKNLVLKKLTHMGGTSGTYPCPEHAMFSQPCRKLKETKSMLNLRSQQSNRYVRKFLVSYEIKCACALYNHNICWDML